MAFAPEDKRAWLDSEIMAEFEKVAREIDLLNGGPPEAFQPIPEKVVTQPVWEDEDISEPTDSEMVQNAELLEQNLKLIAAIEKMAQDFADKGHIKVAYRLERALFALREIVEQGGK